MSDGPKEWQTPHRTKQSGWVEIPMWVMNAGAIPHPRHKWTLPNGDVAEPGDWIVAAEDGTLSVRRAR